MITTYTGKTVDFVNPTPEMIDIEDIAHALSHEARWANMAKRRYTVAEHSVQVSYLSEHPKAALLHDATEAYMRDIPGPLKKLLPSYKGYEQKLRKVIFNKYGLVGIPLDVHYWDKILGQQEYENLVEIPESQITWRVLSQYDAKKAFLKRFNELWNL